MNLPTFTLDATAVTARNAEYTGTPFTDGDGDGSYTDPYLGCNRAGSCAPGIGIATDNIDPKLADWSILGGPVENYLARDAQSSQHLGGTGLAAGDEGIDTVSDIGLVLDPYGAVAIDFADGVGYIAAVVQAIVGAGYNTAAADPVNRSSRTIEIGERLWGSRTIV